MPEPKGTDVRTLAVRVSPDYHAQLSMVAQVDEMQSYRLMMAALDSTWPRAASLRTSRPRSRRRWKTPRHRWPGPGPCCSARCPKAQLQVRLVLRRKPRVEAARERLPAEVGVKPKQERRAALLPSAPRLIAFLYQGPPVIGHALRPINFRPDASTA